MGAMKRVARFFSLTRSTQFKETSVGCRTNELPQITSDLQNGTSRLCISEMEWREAPRKYQELVQHGKTVRVIDVQGTEIIVLGFTSISKDANAEKEMEELLESCAGDRISVSASWLE